ncbi:hypothetical protein [Hyalangium sp.]|uniref:hypothetical protein n=1 Tax=Hyalangium sp. TaxID=2028555 RepID=UPI002D7460E2|nr:hypothetical protein [Hyalangium sp.]HYH99003.1 hypothetical protein [Hyalangium sp.]
MTAINRWNRSPQFDRVGELLDGVAPAQNRQWERPPVEAVSGVQNRFQDGFDAAHKRLQDGFEPVGKRPPVELSTIDKLLTSEAFQQRLQETLEGTSARAQQVKQVESTYQAFWKDSQDFSVRSGPALSVPEPPRYQAPAETAWKGRVLTVPEFKATTDDLPETARVQQTAQASAATLEARRVAAITEQPFSLLGRVALRG